MVIMQGTAEGLNIGIIMDGNGRWAKKRGLPNSLGHKRGAEVFSDIVTYLNTQKLQSVTFYAFSTENWKRSVDEVDGIMKLFREYLFKAFNYEKENNKVVFLGQRNALSNELQRLMDRVEGRTAQNTGMILNIAINYGGREEITAAAARLCRDVQSGSLNSLDICEAEIEKRLYTAGQKQLDFVMRPSGECRLSNFMLWQAAYAELIFMDVLWPDFTVKDFDKAVLEFWSRNRRFGGR